MLDGTAVDAEAIAFSINLVVKAIGQKDFPVVVGCMTMLAVVFVTINFVVDVLYGYLDARVRHA